MTALAAHLPDAVIGFAPDGLEMIEQCTLKFPGGGEILQASSTRLMQRVHHLAVDIELKLVRSGIADAHRLRTFVAAEPGDLALAQPSLAGNPPYMIWS